MSIPSLYNLFYILIVPLFLSQIFPYQNKWCPGSQPSIIKGSIQDTYAYAAGAGPAYILSDYLTAQLFLFHQSLHKGGPCKQHNEYKGECRCKRNGLKGFQSSRNQKSHSRRDCTTPHSTFLPFFGFRSPLDENMASTKVPEFAEVMKNVHNNIRDTTHRIIPRGYCPITMNSPVSGLLAISASWATESVPSIPKCSPRLPIMANQRMDPRAVPAPRLR